MTYKKGSPKKRKGSLIQVSRQAVRTRERKGWTAHLKSSYQPWLSFLIRCWASWQPGQKGKQDKLVMEWIGCFFSFYIGALWAPQLWESQFASLNFHILCKMRILPAPPPEHEDEMRRHNSSRKKGKRLFFFLERHCLFQKRCPPQGHIWTWAGHCHMTVSFFKGSWEIEYFSCTHCLLDKNQVSDSKKGDIEDLG